MRLMGDGLGGYQWSLASVNVLKHHARMRGVVSVFNGRSIGIIWKRKNEKEF